MASFTLKFSDSEGFTVCYEKLFMSLFSLSEQRDALISLFGTQFSIFLTIIFKYLLRSRDLFTIFLERFFVMKSI